MPREFALNLPTGAVDAEFVVDLAGQYDLPCDVVRVNLEQDRKPGESFELAARRIYRNASKLQGLQY